MTFNEVLGAWSNCKLKGAAEHAEILLNEMERRFSDIESFAICPDRVSYNTVLKALAKSSDPHSARKAEHMLDRMQVLHKSGRHNIMPDRYTYNVLMKIYGKAGDAAACGKVENILNFLEQHQHLGGNESLKPDVRSYVTAINAYAKSNVSRKARKCRSILDRMIELYEASGKISFSPNVHSYTNVINACAYTSGSESENLEALQIAKSTFEELSQSSYAKPNGVSYNTFLLALSKLMSTGEECDRYVEATFKQCRDDGLVNDKCLSILRRAASSSLYRKLTECL